MNSQNFIANLEKENNFDYGLCPPPISADKGLQVLIEHFLGDDWYVTMPLSTEQTYTEAIYTILENNQKKKSLLKRIFSRFFT